jgi:acyl-CoA synthetase (AMP-forming)/AMP-acid ligase II
VRAVRNRVELSPPAVLHGPPLDERMPSTLGAPGDADANVGAYLARAAALSPDLEAVIEPRGSGWKRTSYAELDARCDAIAHGLREIGLARGDRTAVFVPPSSDLIALVFALFKLGAVPVLLDPGMGRESVVACLARMKPRAFVGVPLAHIVRGIHARELSSIEIDVVVGRRWILKAPTLARIARPARGAFSAARTGRDETAAILFTSGSTGPAKGVVYAHGMFAAQIETLKRLYAIRPGEVDLACFPLFALFDAALRTTCVIPRLDPSHPGSCDPARVADALVAHRCTYSFGSPAIWRRVAPFAAARGFCFPDLERVLIAGAPVSPALVAALRTRIAERGDVHTPYGATESLPLTSISGAEILDVRSSIEGGFGTCVGRAAPGVDIALIPVEDRAIADWSDVTPLGHDSIGEVCVRGAVVTREYADDGAATRAAKIADGEAVVHRTGDAGWIDTDGRLWIVGRTSHRIETRAGVVWPVPLENVCDLHPRLTRTALVGVGERRSEQPVLVVEPRPGEMPRGAAGRERFAREIAALRAAHERPDTPTVLPDLRRVLFRESLPVDVRHNAKIRREILKAWAAARLDAEVDADADAHMAAEPRA